MTADDETFRLQEQVSPTSEGTESRDEAYRCPSCGEVLLVARSRTAWFWFCPNHPGIGVLGRPTRGGEHA